MNMLTNTALQVLSTGKEGDSGKIKEERRNVAHCGRSGSRYTVNATTMKHFITIAFLIFKKEINSSSVNKFIITKH